MVERWFVAGEVWAPGAIAELVRLENMREEWPEDGPEPIDREDQ